MKRLFSALLISALLLALLAGCGGSSGGSAPSSGDHIVTLHLGDTDEQIGVADGARAAQPEDPEREGYVFAGWYADEGFTEKFVFSTKIEADTDVYARWLACATFEAEDLIMDDLSGPGYSGGSSDYDMIIKDRWEAGASGGKFVSYLYAKYDSTQYNTTLEFHVTSDAAVSDAALILRLSAEYADITINGDMYEVLVNGTKIGYDDITFEGAAAATDEGGLLPFADYTISSGISLKAGDNVITLRTANTEKQGSGGTMNSTAPIVDCIKLAAENATLTWTPGFSTTDE